MLFFVYHQCLRPTYILRLVNVCMPNGMRGIRQIVCYGFWWIDELWTFLHNSISLLYITNHVCCYACLILSFFYSCTPRVPTQWCYWNVPLFTEWWLRTILSIISFCWSITQKYNLNMCRLNFVLEDSTWILSWQDSSGIKQYLILLTEKQITVWEVGSGQCIHFQTGLMLSHRLDRTWILTFSTRCH